MEKEEEGSGRRVEGRRCRGAVVPPWPRLGEQGRERERYGKGRDGKRERERGGERGVEEIFLPSADTPWPTLAQLPYTGYANTF